MKLDRLLTIVTLLLQRERMTAPELADRLEVSKRTIHRDVEAICQAGIPVITYQGGNGGIAIAKGYKLDRSLLTNDELSSILAGLKGLGSISEHSRIEKLIHKLSPQSEAVVSMKDPILIDLSSHYKGSLNQKIELIKSAIFSSQLVRFTYYSEKGKSDRLVEPVNICFKWSSWYLFGYCRESSDFRLFKLNRLWDLNLFDETFTEREISPERRALGQHLTDENPLTLIMDRDLEYQVVDEYGPQAYEILEDGRLLLKVRFTNYERTLFWIMGFGDKAKVLEPESMAQEIQKRAKNLLRRYEQDI